MTKLKGKSVLISGGSRGIGKAIAIRLASEGANIIIAAKTENPHPALEGTIYTASEEIIAAGGNALPIVCDIRNEEQVDKVIEQAAEKFGGIDILINNASAIQLLPANMITMKQYDLMMDINVRGTYMLSKKCFPYLKKSASPNIVTLSPPISIDPKWFSFHTAYTVSKYSMSLIVYGLAEEFRKYNIACNALWPATLIGTAAVKNLLGGEEMIKRSRKPEIVAEAVFHLLNGEFRTGQFLIDENILRENGISDFSSYAVDPNETVQPDLFI